MEGALRTPHAFELGTQNPHHHVDVHLRFILDLPGHLLELLHPHLLVNLTLNKLPSSPPHLHNLPLQLIRIGPLCDSHMFELELIAVILQNILTVLQVDFSLNDLQWLLPLEKIRTVGSNEQFK